MTTDHVPARPGDAPPGPPDSPDPPGPALLRRARGPERRRLIDRCLRRELGRVLGVPAGRIADGCTPASLGMGSMKSLELQRRLVGVLGVDVGVQRILLAGSVRELADHLAARLGDTDVA